jgi:hypothetical protein
MSLSRRRMMYGLAGLAGMTRNLTAMHAHHHAPRFGKRALEASRAASGSVADKAPGGGPPSVAAATEGGRSKKRAALPILRCDGLFRHQVLGARGTEKCRSHGSEKRQIQLWRLSRREEGAPPVVAGGAERRKPDWPLYSEAVRRMLTAGLESKKEIPACIKQRYPVRFRQAERIHGWSNSGCNSPRGVSGTPGSFPPNG